MDKENLENVLPHSNLNESTSYFITDSRPLTKHQLRAEAGGDNKNKSYINLEEHSRMTEMDHEADSVEDLHQKTKLVFKTSRPHHKGGQISRNTPMNNTVIAGFAPKGVQDASAKQMAVFSSFY